jgi:hypothetical protein
MLAKRFGDAWSVRNHGDASFEENLDAFFQKHWKCMAGVVEDPYKFLLLNELEQMEYSEKVKASSTS